MKPALDLPIFVPDGKEEQYFQKNNITFKKLASGIKLIGVPREVHDIYDASVQYVFDSGSHNDPRGKKGIHHLFEHLILNRIQMDPKSVDIYKNAYTTHRQLVVETQGTANPAVKNYGMWPMFQPVISVLQSPQENIPESQIENEVKVVLQEIAEKNTNPNYHAYKFLCECIYDKINPLRADTPGNTQDLRSITMHDLNQIAKRVFVPKNLTVRVFSEGEIDLSKKVIDEIEKSISDFPKTEGHPLTVDLELQEKINTDFKPGKLYLNDDGLKNKLVNVTYAWIFPSLDFTSHSFALSRLTPLLHDDFLKYSRENGLGYSSYVSQFNHMRMRVITMSITLSKEIGIETIQNKLSLGIRDHVLKELSDSKLRVLFNNEKLIQQAVPMSTKSRANILQEGMDYYGKIIDADKVKAEYKKISLEDFKDWRDKLLEIDPAIIISGDTS